MRASDRRRDREFAASLNSGPDPQRSGLPEEAIEEDERERDRIYLLG
jgi:hypothetical protein